MKIDVENLYFSYSKKQVLRGINLHVANAGIVCIVGPNGSGKSTLIKCIESLIVFRSGRILFDGIDSRSIKRMDIAKLIAYVPQSSSQCFSTTVFDTILMGRRPYSSWHSSNKDIEAVIQIIKQMDLEDIALEDFNHLSGGQQQRVFIARALAQEPKALLLDEPTSALDIAHQLDTMDIIYNLVKQHKISVIMILHDLNLASRYADKIVMLYNGKIHAEGSPKAVFTKENMAEVYGIESSIQINNGKISILPICRCENEKNIKNSVCAGLG